MNLLKPVFFVMLIPLLAFGKSIDQEGNIAYEKQVYKPGEMIFEQQTTTNELDEIELKIDPGEAPEGDFLGSSIFTNDGQRLLVTNRITNNISVFAVESMEMIHLIPTGEYPTGIAITNDYIIVACTFANQVYVFNLEDYSLVEVFDTSEQPWIVHVSPDGNKAFVACDIEDVCEVINLRLLVLERSIESFPLWLRGYSWNSEVGRNDISFSDFEVSHSGEFLIAADGISSVKFFNTNTGNCDFTVDNITSCSVIGLSGDGNKLVAINSIYPDPPVLFQIDMETRQIEESVRITGYSLSTYDVAINMDGSKAFVGVSNNSSALVNFETQSFRIFTETYTPFWLGTSPDHETAISGQYRLSLIDFELETIIGQYMGYAMQKGCVSPQGFNLVGYDPLRHEGMYFFNCANPGNPIFRGTTISGSAPEGDAPRRVDLASDMSRAVVCNVLSDNVSIIDPLQNEVLAILDVGDRVQDVEITHDSQWAVVAGFNSNLVSIIDLNSNQIVAQVEAGNRPGVLSISPDDSRVYVGNISSNTISVIQLDGANSSEIAEVACGTIGVLWAAYGISSDIQVSPDGQYVLIAASFDDEVKVFDTTTNTIVQSLQVGDYPLQIAFDETGEYAVVSNYFDDSCNLISVDGEDSEIIADLEVIGGPFRVAYNQADNEFAVGSYTGKSITRISLETRQIVGTDPFTQYGPLIQLKYNDEGEAVVLCGTYDDVAGYLIINENVYELPANPAYFDYDSNGCIAAVAMPGPDFVSVINWSDEELPPTEFVLESPENQSHLLFHNPYLANLSWQDSFDPNIGENVSYEVNLVVSGWFEDDINLNYPDINDNHLTVDIPQELELDFETRWPEDIEVEWWVIAHSGEESSECEEHFSFILVSEPNNPPAPFSLQIPEDEDTFELEDSPSILITFNWEETLDRDIADTEMYYDLVLEHIDNTSIRINDLDENSIVLDFTELFGLNTEEYWTELETFNWHVEAISNNDTTTSQQSFTFNLSYYSEAVDDDFDDIPRKFGLSKVYPNPFNPVVNIEFTLPETSLLKMEVINVIGQKVDEVIDGEFQAGIHLVSWEAENYPSGIYFISLNAGSNQALKKIMLLK